MFRTIFFNIIYFIFLLALSPLILNKIFVKGKYLKHLKERLGFFAYLRKKDVVWIHGVSVGEIKSAQPLISQLKNIFNNLEIVVSSTSASGRMMAEKLYPDCQVISFPLDFSWGIRRFFEYFSPRIIILLELEIWPNFLFLAREKKIPVFLLNGR